MSEPSGLVNQRVMIVLRRFHPQTPREVIRGIVTEADEFGIRVSGRRFQEFSEREGSLPEERPVERETKLYWVPFNSIRYSEIIATGSDSEREDNEVQRRKPVLVKPINRPSAS